MFEEVDKTSRRLGSLVYVESPPNSLITSSGQFGRHSLLGRAPTMLEYGWLL